MDLGEKLKQARLEAGLSQRELCAGEITRNMLSQIENGSARPSMKTLAFFARRLGRPVSWFLEETAVVSPNLPLMADARRAFDGKDWAGAVEALNAFTSPDEVFQRERDLIWAWSHMALAEQALDRGQAPYARQLLEQGAVDAAYCAQALERKRLLLLGRMGQPVSGQLPSLDEELLLRAGEARDAGYAAALLDAAQDKDSPRWNLLRGDAFFAQGAWQEAAVCYRRAEAAFPGKTIPKLEACCKELGDYKQAYAYACKRRERENCGPDAC